MCILFCSSSKKENFWSFTIEYDISCMIFKSALYHVDTVLFYLDSFLACPIVLAPFVKKIVLSPLHCCCQRIVDCICLFLSRLVCSVHLYIYSFTNSILYWLLLPYSKSWSREVLVHQLSSSSLLCWLFWPFAFHINFWLSLSISKKEKKCWDWGLHGIYDPVGNPTLVMVYIIFSYTVGFNLLIFCWEYITGVHER